MAVDHSVIDTDSGGIAQHGWFADDGNVCADTSCAGAGGDGAVGRVDTVCCYNSAGFGVAQWFKPFKSAVGAAYSCGSDCGYSDNGDRCGSVGSFWFWFRECVGGVSDNHHGVDNRGLTQQYMRALMAMEAEFLFVSVEPNVTEQRDIRSELAAYPRASTLFLDNKKMMPRQRLETIVDVVKQYQPQTETG